MKVRIKKLREDAIVPTYAKPGDAGMDLTAISVTMDDMDNIVYGTGLAFEIPKGFVGLIFPRSSNSKKDLYLTNHVGVLDSGYRGEVGLKFRETTRREEDVAGGYTSHIYSVGDRIAQLMIIPHPEVEFEEVEELESSERGKGGWGSTGS